MSTSVGLRLKLIFEVESGFLPLYTNHGIGLTTTWSPLASGVLTGKYNKGSIPSDSRFALENYKRNPFNLANRSLVDDAGAEESQRVSSVITGATRESQIQENMKAVDVIPLLTPHVQDKIEQSEWREIGVQQSRGWVHHAIHRPEPHIMLFRRTLNYQPPNPIPK
ncbi:hypothetical protein Bca52824_066144 [Brassica carinata]|uniref:Cyclin-dependent kinases regulatory subunit n=3 Tax=Brassica TaxID=3705 RepID=A0A8X7UAN5_BRACI|nr:hypothetical protein Bca52824_066144 [Brassica carinata]